MSSSIDCCQDSGERLAPSAPDELSLRRAGLDQLREKERELLDQLHLVCAATRVQRDRIRASCPTPADLTRHLPAEVLLRIIEFALQNPLMGCDSHRHVKRELASVSCRWRDLILGSPSLWNCIRICKSWTVPFVKAHIARSAECPLSIEVCTRDWEAQGGMEWGAIAARLSVLIHCRHRWRSLVLKTVDRVIMSSIASSEGFTSLKRLTIINDGPTDPFWFGPVDWLSVDYLELRSRVDLNYLSNLSNLETLIVHIPLVKPPRTQVEFSLRKLKTLSLSGYTGELEFRPDTLHFPLLDSLSVNVTCARGLMEAIVAPNLRRVRYTPYSCDSDMSCVFGNLSSKFLSVEHLCLCNHTEAVANSEGH
ncbi:hypothetical protein EDC04DRAFT_1784969 [Pisolithus marmoratus]|nr:hypothetical protein EDC04DRAFT_1784969 [Pisolithus marmoratus]